MESMDSLKYDATTHQLINALSSLAFSKGFKYIEGVRTNGYPSVLLFYSCTADDEWAPYGLQGEHFFITSHPTYGKKFSPEYASFMNSKYSVDIKVSKTEFESIYKEVCRTKRFNVNIKDLD